MFYKKDPYLGGFVPDIIHRINRTSQREAEFLMYKGVSLIEFANAYKFFGEHLSEDKTKVILREYAPNAKTIHLVGDFNRWIKNDVHKFDKLPNGVYEITVDLKEFASGRLYKILVTADNWEEMRMLSYVKRVVQDPLTNLFACELPSEELLESYAKHNREEEQYENLNLKKSETKHLKIYEAHIGIAGEEGKVHSFDEFYEYLDYVRVMGYNTIQLMGVAEHPYYGSLGYHVSSFFAVSSRFGEIESFKRLIDKAHKLGLNVIMDLIHSHSVKNREEGLAFLDGEPSSYFHKGERSMHPLWDSYCFNYGNEKTVEFLLSNIAFWMREYKIDGFRFDGVTSMIYKDHGVEKGFDSYDDYFGDNIDMDALIYLTMANKLMKAINPNSISIAEDVSAYPGLCAPIINGGVGFDYRMSMGIADFFHNSLGEEFTFDNVNLSQYYDVFTSKRVEENVINYLECHDQSIMGDKTLIFRLLDAKMYNEMAIGQSSFETLKKLDLLMIVKIMCIATSNGGYLNFIGNEWGHPEWLDFPSEANKWSYEKARRLLSLRDNHALYYNKICKIEKDILEIFKNIQSDNSSVYWRDKEFIHIKRDNIELLINGSIRQGKDIIWCNFKGLDNQNRGFYLLENSELFRIERPNEGWNIPPMSLVIVV